LAQGNAISNRTCCASSKSSEQCYQAKGMDIE
jgi:hypothetical protein